MKPTEDTTKLILELKSQGYTKGSIVRAIKKATKSTKHDATQYVEYVLSARKNALRTNIDLGVDESKAALISSGLTGIACLTLGGIITGVSYSATESGGTYMATSGLFLVGAISLLVAVYQLVRLLYYVARRSHTQSSRVIAKSQPNEAVRTWSDLA